MQTVLDRIARPLAAKMIARFGAPLLYTRVLYDDTTPATSTSEAEEDTETYELKGVVSDLNPLSAASLRAAASAAGAAAEAGIILAGDKMVMVAAETIAFIPIVGDRLEVFGVTYRVMTVRTDYSGGQPALYNIQIRE